MEFSVVGLKVHHYIGKTKVGNNCDFHSQDIESVKYIICLINMSLDKYELELWMRHGECPSGWTTAHWAEHKLTKVCEFGSLTHIPNSNYDNIVYEDSIMYYKSDFFSYSYDGDDHWYPEGSIEINFEKFKKYRGFEKKPVWIFQGDSNLGKSFIAHKLSGMKIFETDAYQQLPDIIDADIIVIGNKYKHSKNDILSQISGEIINVDFSK